MKSNDINESSANSFDDMEDQRSSSRPLGLTVVCISDPGHEILRPKPRRPNGSNSRDHLECPAYAKNGTAAATEMAERDATPTPQPRTIGCQAHHHPSQHQHLSLQELKALQRNSECNSSSDENRSSGHASMTSDTGGHTSSSSPGHRHQINLNSVPEDGRLCPSVSSSQLQQMQQQQNLARTRRQRGHRQSSSQQQQTLQIAETEQQMQQLTLRSRASTSTSSSTYSSLSGNSESSEPPNRRLLRHSSLETVNTSATSAADEFVWVESHSRLVELGRAPWTQRDVVQALRASRARDRLAQLQPEVVPRLSYLLQRALVRLGREAQRLARPLGFCGRREIWSALRVVLSPGLFDSCGAACLRAAAMYAVKPSSPRQSKAALAGLQLPVGSLLRWMVDVRLGRMVHELGAVYLAAALENMLEVILLQSLPEQPQQQLSATLLEHAVANNPELWGLLQPYAHLNAGRIASGALALPRWPSATSLGSSSGKSTAVSSQQQQQIATSPVLEASLLTTCVGSVRELRELLTRLAKCGRCPLGLSEQALGALFYYMRCSQLERGERGPGIQELAYERAYVVLPPLVEWLRVATGHAEYRHARQVDRDDIGQAARLLLPGVDCPERPLWPEHGKIDALNNDEDSGLNALMLACVTGDENAALALLEAGADPNAESSQHWTALTHAALLGHTGIARLLLSRGAVVEGGARPAEGKCAITPLQAAAGAGNLEVLKLLLNHGAQPFLSTLPDDGLCYAGSTSGLQRGCYSAISVAAAHGQRACLQQLLSHPPNFAGSRGGEKEVLSLEEILAEGQPTVPSQQPNVGDVERGKQSETFRFSKVQYKALQEAMYHSVESNHLDITMEFRALGVSWTLHCWMHSLSTAHEMRVDSVIDQLLQDFLQVCPDDYSTQFVDECLPLLFNIFRYSKKEGTILLLADIFCTCYGWEPIKPISDASLSSGGSRIDPKFVNNPELSDVQFRVEGRVFYGHKIVLVTSSPRFRNMLSSKLCEGNPPIVQINDIRYHIFQLVMEFLYNGGCSTLKINQSDVLELMAAANFFQLNGLLRFCEAQCSTAVNLDNIVSMYIHAKVYNAVQLLEYCQGFLLQNMVALLTYDDSVKRLLFAKKLPNHDVLTSLLFTLQARIKAKRPQN